MKNCKKLFLAPVLALGLVLLPGCLAGPYQLTRSWDDWVNEKYSQDSWIHGALFQVALPVYPLAGGVLSFVDVLVVNPYYFWSEDIWDRRGTAFKHADTPESPRTIEGSF